MSVEFTEHTHNAFDYLCARVSGNIVATIQKRKNGWLAVLDDDLTAEHLRAIADKLDELNGVKE